MAGEPSGLSGDEGGGRGAVVGRLGVVGGGGEEGASGEGGAKVVVSGERCAERTKAAQSFSRWEATPSLYGTLVLRGVERCGQGRAHVCLNRLPLYGPAQQQCMCSI